MHLFDSHVHVVHGDAEAYPRRPLAVDHHSVAAQWYEAPGLATEDLVARMDAAGVARAALVQVVSLYGTDNRYVAESVARFPDRFVGVGAVDPGAADVEDQVAAGVADGLAAFRLYYLDGAPTPGDPGVARVWQACADHGASLTVTVLHPELDWLVAASRARPEVAVALEHLGMPGRTGLRAPEVLDLLAPVAGLDQVVLKYSNMNLATLDGGVEAAPRLVAAVVETFGADRLAWGSNHPATADPPYDELVAQGRASVAALSPADQATVLGGTAEHLWGAAAERA
ncbi:MAG: amidohydrolase [Acidimicrobiia bacterium]